MNACDILLLFSGILMFVTFLFLLVYIMIFVIYSGDIRQGFCVLMILFNLYIEHLTKEAFEWFGDFKNRRKSNSHCDICRLPCDTG
jgi:hypothetical protein